MAKKTKQAKKQLDVTPEVPAPMPPPGTPVMVDGLKLDIGCGTKKREGHIGVDRIKFPGVDVTLDIGHARWPWKDGTVAVVECHHVLEHLDNQERVHFFNELYRVLKKGGQANFSMPHWASSRYYGDPTHKSPPFSEFGWHYLKKEWRLANAPHVDAGLAPGTLSYACDFEYSYGYGLAPWLQGRAKEFVDFALMAYKEAAQDMLGSVFKPTDKPR